ncbi:MAG: ureidoglycolate lyase [Nitratireductor sp.]|nr:ureidoglycolate lyase [Nitratireductor sp.]
MTTRLHLQPLTRESFTPFGDVIAANGADSFLINNGSTERFHDLARVETTGDEARTLISIFRGQPFSAPFTIAMMERHPLGSQAFFPLHSRPWLVVVAPDVAGKPGEPLAFVVRPDVGGLVGVNYARNTWHHPLISLEEVSDFLVVDRGGEGVNLEEHFFATPYVIASAD